MTVARIFSSHYLRPREGDRNQRCRDPTASYVVDMQSMNESTLYVVLLTIAFVSVKLWLWKAPQASRSPNLARRPRRAVQHEIVEVIHVMFSNIPQYAIAFNLEFTGSIERTTELILAQGLLLPQDSPLYALYALVYLATSDISQSTEANQNKNDQHDDLITRYNL
jgi:hypothetical protein